MKNDTSYLRMRSGDRFGDAKMSNKSTSLREIKLFINCDRLKGFSQNKGRWANLQNVASDLFNFCLPTWL